MTPFWYINPFKLSPCLHPCFSIHGCFRHCKSYSVSDTRRLDTDCSHPAVILSLSSFISQHFWPNRFLVIGAFKSKRVMQKVQILCRLRSSVANVDKPHIEMSDIKVRGRRYEALYSQTVRLMKADGSRFDHSTRRFDNNAAPAKYHMRG